MRFLALFGKLALVAAVTVGVLVLVLIEGRLRWAARQLASDFRFTAQQAHDLKDAVEDQCYFEKAITFKSEANERAKLVEEVRLRFINDTDYVIEAVCTSKSVMPVEIKKGSLILGTVKVAGSGVAVPSRKTIQDVGRELPLNGRVLINSYFRSLEVGYFDNEIDWKSADGQNWDNEGLSAAATSCEGWGLQCCSEVTEVGAGPQEDRVIDCFGNCYGYCKQRPVILYFNTDPIMDAQERTVYVSGGVVPLTFGFEVVDTDSVLRSVEIDFGDGESYIARNSQENVVHDYVCGSGTCVHRAVLTAEDEDGLVMGESRLQEITVIQRAR